MHDVHDIEQYYAMPSLEWDRALQEHLKLGHPESYDDRYFAGLPDSFTVRVRAFLPNSEKTKYYEQDEWIDFPANRVVADFTRLMRE